MSSLLLSDVLAALERAVGDDQTEKRWLNNFNMTDMGYVMTAVTVCRQETSSDRKSLRLLTEFFHAEERYFARDIDYKPDYEMGREQIYYLSTYFNRLAMLPPEWDGMIGEILDVLTIEERSDV